MSKNLNEMKQELKSLRESTMAEFKEVDTADFDSAKKADNRFFSTFFHELLKNGIYIAPSSYESWFLSDALTFDDLDKTIAVVEKISSKLL